MEESIVCVARFLRLTRKIDEMFSVHIKRAAIKYMLDTSNCQCNNNIERKVAFFMKSFVKRFNNSDRYYILPTKLTRAVFGNLFFDFILQIFEPCSCNPLRN